MLIGCAYRNQSASFGWRREHLIQRQKRTPIGPGDGAFYCSEWRFQRLCNGPEWGKLQAKDGQTSAKIDHFTSGIRSFRFRNYRIDALKTDELFECNRREVQQAFERLAILNEADEKSLLLIPALHYHKLKGTSKYSIGADSRNSPWRITFQWENAEMKNVELVRIEDTH